MTKYVILLALTLVVASCATRDCAGGGRELLSKMEVSSVAFDGVSLEQFASWVVVTSRDLDPKGVGFTVKLSTRGVGGLDRDALAWRKVAIKAKNISLLDVLDLVSSDTSTRFRVVGREIEIGSAVDYKGDDPR